MRSIETSKLIIAAIIVYLMGERCVTMAQRPSEKVTLKQVLKLVDKLSPEEVLELQRKLNDRTWGKRFEQLCEKIEANRLAKGLPKLTDEEIIAEVKAVRNEMKAERGHQGSH